MGDFKKLHEFTDGRNRTGQVFYTGKDNYMVLLFEADLDYNEMRIFTNEEESKKCAMNWVPIYE